MTRDKIQLKDHSLTKSGCFLGDRVRTRQRSTPSFMGCLRPSTHAALRIENATLPTPSWWAQESAGSATKISGNVRTAGTCFTHITDILWTSLWVSVGVSQSVSPLSYLPNSNPWSLVQENGNGCMGRRVSIVVCSSDQIRFAEEGKCTLSQNRW